MCIHLTSKMYIRIKMYVFRDGDWNGGGVMGSGGYSFRRKTLSNGIPPIVDVSNKQLSCFSTIQTIL